MVFSDPEVVQAMVQIVGVELGGEPPTTVEKFEGDLAEQIATQLLTRRLNDLVQRGEARTWVLAHRFRRCSAKCVSPGCSQPETRQVERDARRHPDRGAARPRTRLHRA